MKHVGQIASQVLPNGQETSAGRRSGASTRLSVDAKSIRRMANLWERMIHTYDNKWTLKHGESVEDIFYIVNKSGVREERSKLTPVAETWATGLVKITGEQLANGLRACIESRGEWPPTLPQFRAWCLPEKQENQEMYKRPSFLALPRPPTNKIKMAANIGEMRKLLSTKDKK